MADSKLTERTYLDALMPILSTYRDSLVTALAAHPRTETFVIEVDPVYYGLQCVSDDVTLLSEIHASQDPNRQTPKKGDPAGR